MAHMDLIQLDFQSNHFLFATFAAKEKKKTIKDKKQQQQQQQELWKVIEGTVTAA